ncbi:MAG: T9SS type A sorting domain-containing protein [Bacteroidota bacterium]
MRKVYQFFAVLLLGSLSAASSFAQCNPSFSTPTVEIGSACLQSPGTVTVPATTFNWGATHAWEITLCALLPPGASITAVNSQLGGQTINYDPSTGEISISYGDPGGCGNLPLFFSSLADIEITFSGKTSPGTCVLIDACKPSVIYKCGGSGEIQFVSSFQVAGCAGEICLGSGVSSVSVSGTVRNAQNVPIEDAEVYNSLTSGFVLTDANGDYTLSNLPVACEATVDIWLNKDDSPDGLNTLDRDLIVQYILGPVTLNCEQMLGADVNGSGMITSFDVIGLTNYLNGSSTNNGFAGDWRFYPQFYPIVCDPVNNSVTSPPNKQTVSINGSSVSGVNFTGIKYGDVTLNAFSKAEQFSSLDQELDLKVLPNPFSTHTSIQFELSETSQIELQVFDLTGRQLTARQVTLDRGAQEINLEANDWPAGMLIYDLQVNGIRHTGRMMHLD